MFAWIDKFLEKPKVVFGCSETFNGGPCFLLAKILTDPEFFETVPPRSSTKLFNIKGNADYERQMTTGNN